ncbi:MAG: hypothetical protein HUK02_07490, partial [Bacteroidaceae bacterium]|nr:hypothetical protein [Bacteroidaceae bacterium]
TITIPTYNERGTGAVTKNLCGFVTDDGEEYLAETTTFPVGQWTNEVIKFSLSEETSGHFSIGYEASNAGSGSMPHLFVDEFTLMYNGVINNPSLIALQGAVRNAANYTESEERYEEAIRERLQTAAENGQSLLSAASADETANVAAVTAINSAIDEAMASMAVYQKFLAFIEGDLAAAIDKYGDNEVMEYFDEDLNDTRDTYMTAYEDGSYTTQQINEAIAALKPAVLAAVQSALAAAAADGEAHDIDISLLFENISFTNQSTAGWTATYTSGKFESQQSGVCEVWSNAAVDFTASTTLNGLPAGAYEVSAPGWFRDAGDMNVGYDHYTSGEMVGVAYIFANGNKTMLLNQADERLLADAEDDMHNGVLSDGQYLPNGQACAQQVFYNSDIDVTNTVTTALLEAGDLTIGFSGAGLQSGTWTVWGAMTVKYKGNTDDLILTAMNEEISALIDEAVTTGMIDEVGYVNQACTQLDDATEQGDAALTVDDRATKTAAIAALREAIAYAKESGNTYVALGEKFTLYSEYLMPDVEGESQRFENLLQDIGAGIDDGFESKEQMEEMMADLSTLFTDYVMGPVRESASEAEPADITAAILNPSFEGILNPNNQKEYWTASKDGGNEGYQAGIYEFYGNNSFDIHQTVTGLSEGYYRVRVQSFYRPGNNQDVADSLSTCGTDYGRYAVLYANDLQQALKNPLERADEDGNLSTDILAGEGSEVAVKWGDVEQFYVPNDRTALAHYFEAGIYWNTLDVKVGADGVLTIGLRKSQSVAGDWCPFDNFELYYLGTTAPTAVESIADDTERTAQNSSWFDLQGRRVLRPTHGVYIRDGKKVLK